MAVSKLLGKHNEPSIDVEIFFDAKPALYHLYPSSAELGSQALTSTNITGRFQVTLKKTEEFAEIYTTLTPRWFVRNKRYKDEGSLPSYSCRIQPPEGKLKAGRHDFPFVFSLPCTVWPSPFIHRGHGSKSQLVQDMSSFNLWYTITLVMQRRQASGRLSKFTTEFPRRRNRPLDSDVDECTDANHRVFFEVVASPVDPGELPPPLEQVIEEFAPQIGPINVILSARTFTPGSLITVNIKLPGVPQDSTLRTIRASVHQTFAWHSLNVGGPTFTDGPFKFPLLTLKPPFRSDDDGRSISIERTARLPDDRYLAPSTLANTITPNRISHHIVLEFVVIDSERQESRINISAPVTLACCTLISEWLSVPEYGASPPLPLSDFQPERPRDPYSCCCGFSLEQLMQREEEGVLPPEEYEPPPIKKRED